MTLPKNGGIREGLYIGVGRLISSTRKRKGFSQAQFAKALGITRTALGNIEQGRSMVKVNKLVRMGMILRSPIHLLIPKEFLYEALS